MKKTKLNVKPIVKTRKAPINDAREANLKTLLSSEGLNMCEFCGQQKGFITKTCNCQSNHREEQAEQIRKSLPKDYQYNTNKELLADVSYMDYLKLLVVAIAAGIILLNPFIIKLFN